MRTRGNTSFEWSADSRGRAAEVPGANGKKRNSRSHMEKPSTRSKTPRLVPMTTMDHESSSNTTLASVQQNSAKNIQSRHTRSQPITCLHYGRRRRFLFPRHYFCSPCDNWEAMEDTGTKWKNQRNSIRNACQAGHTDPLFPTSLNPTIKQYSQTVPIYLSSPDSDSSSHTSFEIERMSEADSVTTLNSLSSTSNDNDNESSDVVAAIKEENVFIKKKVKELIRRNKCLERQQRTLIEKAKKFERPTNVSKEDYTLMLVQAIEGLVQSLQNGKRSKKRKCQLAHSLFGIAGLSEYLIIEAKLNLRATQFSPVRIHRLLDVEGGKLNYSALELLRLLELNKGMQTRRGTVTLIPPTYELKRAARRCEELGKLIAPWTEKRTSLGAEAISFDQLKVLQIVLKASGLADKASDPRVEAASICQAMDGSRFSKNNGFVLQGLKVSDYRANNLWNHREPIYNMNGGQVKSTLQSRNNVVPIYMVCGTENAAIYQELKHDVTSISNNSLIEVDGKQVRVKTDVVCTDLSASWKGTGRGGACKVKEYFCTCCATTSTDVALPNENFCTRFCSDRTETSGFKCFHKEFIDKETIRRWEEEQQAQVEQMTETVSERLESIRRYRANSSFLTRERARMSTGNDRQRRNSIHYDLSGASRKDKTEYSNFLYDELEIRQCEFSGTVTERQAYLKEVLIEEERIYDLHGMIIHGKAGEATALFEAMNNPPCLLHMHNRIVLKKLTTILNVGLASAVEMGELDLVLFPNDQRNSHGTGNRFDAYINLINETINGQIFGNSKEGTESQYSLPVDKSLRKIHTITLDNEKCKKAISKIDLLLDICIADENRREGYKTCFSLFRNFFNNLLQKTPFSNENIQQLQRDIDDWFIHWWNLERRAGITNYIHLLASGHVADYLFHHRNLFKYSNQGWEAFNALVKQVYFRRTQRGGSKQKTRLRPLARWFQRRLVWMLVDSEDSLEDLISSKQTCVSSQEVDASDNEEEMEEDVHEM